MPLCVVKFSICKTGPDESVPPIKQKTAESKTSLIDDGLHVTISAYVPK